VREKVANVFLFCGENKLPQYHDYSYFLIFFILAVKNKNK